MNIAILGGSFNPIHIGHLAVADDVCVSLGYDKVLFVPVYKPAHKEMVGAPSNKDRFEMVRLACRNDNRLEAEDCELKRGGVSYTYDTVCFLEEKYKNMLDSKIGVIIGQDLVGEFHKWENADLLAQKADIILAIRPQDDNESGAFSNQHAGGYTGCQVSEQEMHSFSYPHLMLQNAPIPLSSTSIRSRIGCGMGWRYLVPVDVYRYIIEKKLYGYRKN